MRSLENEIKLRGYSEIPTIIIPTEEIIKTSNIIYPIDEEYLKLKKETLKNTKNNTISFYESFFKLHRVPYYLERQYGLIKIEKKGDIHPFALPIKKEKDTDDFYASLQETIFINEKDTDIYYKSIVLPKNITEITKIAYTHEIAHTQINYVKGLVEEFYNTEVISIFLELVHLLELNDGERLLEIHDSIRLSELKYIINEINTYYTNNDPHIKNVLIEGSLYLQSTLQAYELFYKYYFGTINIKKEILNQIQKVFNHEQTVEKLLSTFDVTLESSSEHKKLYKYITR